MTAIERDDDCRRCGDSKSGHENELYKPQCSKAGCLCMRYTPPIAAEPIPAQAPAPMRAPAPAPAPPAATPTPAQPPPQQIASVPTAEQVIAAGKRSDFKRTASLAKRVESLLLDLRARVIEDGESAKLRQEIDELERLLADKKARLKSGQPPAAQEKQIQPAIVPKVIPAGAYQCPECGKEFDTKQGLGGHKSRAQHRNTAEPSDR